jgi:hypothetical protein
MNAVVTATTAAGSSTSYAAPALPTPANIQTLIKQDLDRDNISNGSSSTWAFSFFVDVKAFIPLMDNLKAVITAGFYSDISAPEFTNWAKSDNKDSGVTLHDRMGFQLGAGIAYFF